MIIYQGVHHFFVKLLKLRVKPCISITGILYIVSSLYLLILTWHATLFWHLSGITPIPSERAVSIVTCTLVTGGGRYRCVNGGLSTQVLTSNYSLISSCINQELQSYRLSYPRTGLS